MRRRNAALAEQGCPLRLEIRGRLLGLRGPLPAREDPGLRRVQRLSLSLVADEEGLLQALARLEGVWRSVEAGTFRWPSKPPPPPSPPGPAGAAPSLPPPGAFAAAGEGELPGRLAAFEAAFFADPRRRRAPAGSRSTWRSAYRPYLRRLEGLAAARRLDATLLLEVLESYELASRSRQQCGIALAALARHQGIALPADWSERAAGYGLHAARFRRLPGDERILELAQAIPNPRWRRAYGLMATYGLRNHEVFFCDCTALAPGGDRVIRVLPTSKTGEHQVWPFPPEWVDHFALEALGGDGTALPELATDLRRTTLRQVGRRVAEQFRRYGLPLTPYDLRHAWAVRTIHVGLPDTVAARMMGHSVTIHTRTYHHWITRRDQQQAVDAALARLRGDRLNLRGPFPARVGALHPDP